MKKQRPSDSSCCSVSLVSGDFESGTRERWVHDSRVFEPTEVAGVFVARVLDEHILDRLVVAGFITSLQRDAGLRFKRDYHAAGLAARLTGSYSPVRGSFSFYGDWDERSDAEEEAYGRWRRAMKFLRGNVGDVVVSVVCYEIIPSVDCARILRCGLKILAQTYGLNEYVDETAAGQVAGQRVGNRDVPAR